DHNHNSALPGFLDGFAQRIQPVALVNGSAHREIDNPDVVCRLQRYGLVNGSDYHAISGGTIGIEDAQVQPPGSGRDALEGLAITKAGRVQSVPGDQAGDM